MPRLVKFRDVSFKVSAKLFPEFWNSFENELFEANNFDILEQYLSRESVFFDLGAWAGPMTLYAAKKVKKVYAFDPDPVIFEELERNVRCNPGLIDKIDLCKFAISRTNAIQSLYARTEYGKSSSSLIKRLKDGVETEKVKICTLDKFCRDKNIPKVDFIKMDIEGSEFEVLPAISDFLINIGSPSLLVSFHGQYFMESLFESSSENLLWNKIKYKLGSKIYSRKNKAQLLSKLKDCFKALNNYTYAYENSGKRLEYKELLNNPLRFYSSDQLFTNVEWK